MKLRNRPWILCSVLMIAILSILSGCTSERIEPSDSDAAEEESEEIPEEIRLEPEALGALRISTGAAELRSLAPVVEVPAEVVPVPDRRATVGPRAEGRVVRVYVNVGDQVEMGSPLVAFESTAVGEAQADLLADEARAEVAEKAAERTRRLRETRVTSARALEEAEGALRQARAEVDAARTRLRAYGLDPAAVHQPGQVVLDSPMAGTVVARDVHVGQWLEPGDSVLEIVDLDEIWVVGAVYEKDLRHVEKEQSVEFQVRALQGESFLGTVAYVGNRLLGTGRTADLRVVMANLDHRLRPGMSATLRIEPKAEADRKALVVPAVAVQEVDHRSFVFVPGRENSFSVRWILVGSRQDGWVEIVDGIEEGETVVTQGSLLLKGQLLRASLGEEE